jgi:O-antigen/teichoic acid export membrane protein
LSIQKKIAKNATHNFLVKFIGLAFGFVASIVVARYLGPGNYGIYSFVIWFLGTVGLLVNLGIPTTITKYVSEFLGRDDFPSVSSIFSRLLRFEIAAGIIVGALLFFLAPVIAGWYDNPDLSLYLKVSSLVILPLGLMWLYNGLFCGLQRFDLIALVNLIAAPITLIIFLAVIFLRGKIEWLVAVSIATNILLIAGYIYFKRARYPSIQKAALKNHLGGKLFRFSAGVFVIVVLEAVVWERFGVFFLSILSTPEEIAFYNVAFIFASRTIILLPGALTGILLPAMSEVYGAGDKEELARVHFTATRYLAILSFPLCLGGIAITGQLFPVLYGNSFSPASIVFAILIVGGTIGSVAKSSSSLLYGAELQRVVVKFELLSAAIIIGASWLLVPLLEAKGAALATTLGQVAGGILLIAYAYKSYMKQSFPFAFILRILVSSVLMGCAAYAIAEIVGGWLGLIFAILVSLPIYIIGLFFTKSFTSGDFGLLDAFIQRLPAGLNTPISKVLNRLIKLFYSGN